MRIIAGELKNRRLETPKGRKTHPMSEKVRGALFNMLGDIAGLKLLDPYAGSGALSFEAISRGAEYVQAIDIDKGACKLMERNAEQLGIRKEQLKITRANAASWSERNLGSKFDIVIIDPPYDKLNLSTISRLAAHLKTKGLMVLSHPGREAAPTVNGVVVVDNRTYGDAALSLYRFKETGVARQESVS